MTVMPGLRVLPIVDLNTGLIQLNVNGQRLEFYSDRISVLVRLMARSIAPLRFVPSNLTLSITVAKHRCSHGERIAFSLAKFPDASLVTTLGCDGKSSEKSAFPPSVSDTDRKLALGDSLP